MTNTTCFVIGCGNTGNQIAALAADRGINGVAINTSTNDLDTVVSKVRTIALELSSGISQGAGKDRMTAKEYLRSSIMDLMHDSALRADIAPCHTVFVVCSTSGGTGSGIGPLIYNILRDTFPETNFILCAVLGSQSESKQAQLNSLEFLKEVDSMGDCTYMLYDNETKRNVPLDRALAAVNEDVVADMLVLSGQYNWTTNLESIDAEDMSRLIGTPGRLVVGRLEDVKNPLDADTLETQLLARVKGSSNAPMVKDATIGACAVIADISEEASEYFDIRVPRIKEFLGDPECDFTHHHINETGVPNRIYFIGAGLAMPAGRLETMSEVVNKTPTRKAAAVPNVFDTLPTPTRTRRAKRPGKSETPETIDLKNIISRYMQG